MDISEILSSLTPEDIEQLRSVASGLMSSGETQGQKEDKKSDENLFSPSLLGNLGKLGSTFSADDERTALLKALKPMLSEQRQSKVEDAIRIMKIIQILPVLRESGLLSGLL